MLSFHDLVSSYLWPVTFYTATVSMVVFIVLVVLRYFSDRRLAMTQARRKEIERQLLIHLAKPLKNLRTLLLKQEEDMEHVAAVAPALLRTLKGRSYERLLESLTQMGLYDWGLKKLHSKNRARCIAAINLMAHWPHKKVKKQLRRLLQHTHPMVQYAAAEALAHMQDPTMLPAILRTFKRHPFSYPLMSDVLRAFGPSAAREVASLIKVQNTPVRLKMAGLIALSHIGTTTQIEKTALPLASHHNEQIRALAFLALARLGVALPDHLLRRGGEDPSAQVRQFVADCAAHNNPLPAELLHRLLQDENWLVGMHAAQALFEGGEAGKRLLRVFSESEKEIVAQRAQMILAEQEAEHGIA